MPGRKKTPEAELLALLPPVDTLLSSPEAGALAERFSRDLVRERCRQLL